MQPELSFWRRASRHPSFVTGGTLVVLMVCCAVLSLFWSPYPVGEIDIPNKLAVPSAAHWFGTDSLGRDIASMLWVGWFGFNVMSAQTIDKISGLVAVNSLMAMVGGTLAALAFVALGPSILAYRCWGMGVQQAGPAVAGFFANLTPLFAAIFSAAFLGELPHLYHALAFGLIIGGIWVSSRQ